MPMFHYEATDPAGKTVVGSMDAKDEGGVHARLAQSGYSSVLVEAPLTAPAVRPTQGSASPPANSATGYAAAPSPAYRGPQAPATPGHSSTVKTQIDRSPGRRSVIVNARDLSQFYRQMASMLNSGVPLPQALAQIVSYIKDKELRAAVEDMEATVARGHPVSEAMERHPRAFSAGQIGLIKSGQGAGYLDRAFSELANQAQSDWDVHTSIKFNPILFILKVVGIPFLVLWVMFMSSFSQWQTNPGLIGHFLLRAAIGAGGAFVFIVVMFPSLSYFVRLSPLGRVIENIGMLVPGLNARRKRIDLVKTLTSLASALNAGVPNTIAWELAAESADTDLFQKKMRMQTGEISRGCSIPDAMERTGLFPLQIMQLVRSGELAGNLPDMLTQASVFEREEARHLGGLMPWVFAVLAYLAFLIIAGYLFINAAAGVYGGIVDKT